MSKSHGTRLRIDAWLPMVSDDLPMRIRADAMVKEVIGLMEDRGFEIISAKDRVTSRREKA